MADIGEAPLGRFWKLVSQLYSVSLHRATSRSPPVRANPPERTSGRACPPASPARPRSGPCPPPPSSRRRPTRLAGAESSRPRLRAPAARLFSLHAKLSARRASRGTSPAKPRCSAAGVPGSVREPTVGHRPPFSSLSRTLGQHSRMNTMGRDSSVMRSRIAVRPRAQRSGALASPLRAEQASAGPERNHLVIAPEQLGTRTLLIRAMSPEKSFHSLSPWPAWRPRRDVEDGSLQRPRIHPFRQPGIGPHQFEQPQREVKGPGQGSLQSAAVGDLQPRQQELKVNLVGQRVEVFFRQPVLAHVIAFGNRDGLDGAGPRPSGELSAG